MTNMPNNPKEFREQSFIPDQEIPVESGDLSRVPEKKKESTDAGTPAVVGAGSQAVEVPTPRIERILQDIDPITGHPKYLELQVSLDEEIKRGGLKAGVNLLIKLASEGVSPAIVENLKEKIKE